MAPTRCGAVVIQSGTLYVPSRNSYAVVNFYTPDDQACGSLRFTHGGRGAQPTMPEGLPLFKPPYSRYTAIDLGKGEIVWMRPLGDGSDVKKGAKLQGLALPPLGGDGFTGPLLTKTLLIHGQEGPDEKASRLVARQGPVVVGQAAAGAPLGTP
jgi:quinoprotein glucose dehydrogenase